MSVSYKRRACVIELSRDQSWGCQGEALGGLISLSYKRGQWVIVIP